MLHIKYDHSSRTEILQYCCYSFVLLVIVISSRCEVTIYIMERLANGITKRLSAQIAYNVFNQASVQAQLGSLGVVRIAPKIQISSSQLQEYLNHPPLGKLKQTRQMEVHLLIYIYSFLTITNIYI